MANFRRSGERLFVSRDSAVVLREDREKEKNRSLLSSRKVPTPQNVFLAIL